VLAGAAAAAAGAAHVDVMCEAEPTGLQVRVALCVLCMCRWFHAVWLQHLCVTSPMRFVFVYSASQAASAAADAARHEAGSARAALSASQSHAQALQARLAAKAAELSGLSVREEALKERVNDLQAFVDVSDAQLSI
jgi:hypothetical protein